tara:strand:- start:477 stop:2087 length:1611 start_codon:yes stop_codon:yes gene_type:complete
MNYQNKYMKKISVILLISLTLISCSTYKFIGSPITIKTAESFNTKLSNEDLKQKWSLLDIKSDKVPGMSVLKANKDLIKGQQGEKVIVAIIDSGVEIDHPYLSNFIWNNSDEIPNNGIDDDKNGYVDDINGWNFLGKSDKENLEYVRLYRKTNKDDSLSQVYKNEIENAINKNNQTIKRVQNLSKLLSESDSLISSILGKNRYSLEEARQISPKAFKIEQAIDFLEFAKSNNWSKEGFSKSVDNYISSNNFHNNIDFKGRGEVGDDPDDFNDRNYGDSNVSDPNKHGTHVSGIVLSISNSSLIMPIRCVPDGDEYDKDVALSIRYAVDNGAKIINFSFGKKYSPHSDWVIDAMKYASANDVLIVTASGNDSNDVDSEKNQTFPTDQIGGIEFIDNVLTVGASTYNYDSKQIANFSNYGSNNVDLFAPGFQIYSSVLDGEFEYLNGTSMAAPNAAGVAAVLRSFYPKLSAPSIKKILIESGVYMFDELTFSNSQELSKSKRFSKSGKTINLYNALLLASNYKEKNPKKSLMRYRSKL